MDEVDKILTQNNIPESTKKMIRMLSKDGREALNSMWDKDSIFWKHAQPVEIATRFIADPEKYKNLFHYTSQQGMESILTSYTFRIGSQYFMNDPEENIYVSKLAEDILKKDERATTQEIKDFHNDFRSVKLDTYIWSFTANDHSQALSRYGDFALEFKNQELQEKLVDYFDPNVQDTSEFVAGNCYVFPLKVEYDEAVQREYVGAVVHTWLSAYRNLAIDPYDMNEIIKDCYYALSLFCMCFKNPLLRQEEEIRFVLLRKSNDNDLHPDTYIKDRPVLLFKFNASLIKSVIYSKQVKDIDKIKKFLVDKGFKNVPFIPTKLPY
ncbi:hypothetical protein [Lactobacillus crispatus]|uniref:hypothetical protein n=1 Tax=Lactobacillus crispatus TaxID=47770 RepID=UPI000B5D9956|nr:hypothetical protein [Lactobacillus crispatus]OXC13845.1 hypothetical protein AYP77_08940 [Lactobacillus crispatus]OXC34939.1 hypothetical protein AYP88_05605 [Lactobacillus crispatus]